MLIVLGALLLLIAVIAIRTISFKPKSEKIDEIKIPEVDTDRAIASLQEMIKCKTVSYTDKSLEDEAEFEKFKQLLKTKYPLINENCELKYIGDTGILYRWKGKNSDGPTVLMSHYDVVPADEAMWEKPAFEGIVESGVIWGRGTIDTKITLCGVMETVEQLIDSGFVPENDIYMAFGGDEEVSGKGQAAIVKYMMENNIKPKLVVDEGGAVVEGVFPGVSGSVALIGTAEKGMLNIDMSVKSSGGHSSAPPADSPVDILAKCVLTLKKNPFRTQISKATAQMFDTLGRRSNLTFRIIFANLWLFRPVLDFVCTKQGGELNALMRTTCVFTKMNGSDAYNVIPTSATVSANLRLLNEDSVERAISYIKKTIDNPNVVIENVYSAEPCRCSAGEGEQWQKVKNAVAGTWQNTPVSPYLMIAGSDSRQYAPICDDVYRFSAMELSKEERNSIHAHNEKISVSKLTKVLEFYQRLIAQC